MAGALVLLGVIAVLATALAIRSYLAGDRSRRTADALGRSVNALQRRIEESEDDLLAMGTVLSSMEEGVVLVGSVGGIRLMNPAAERHLRGHPATLAGLQPIAVQELARRVLAEGTPRTVETETGAPSRWLRTSAIPVPEASSVLLVIRDVTEARRIDAVRRDFVANASHELKTPAASIQAAAETIRTAAVEDPPVVPRFAEQVEREAMRLSRIVSDLLDLSRLEGGDRPEEVVSMNEVLDEEAERLQRPAVDAGVELDLTRTSVPAVTGSRRDLALLVRNLVDNAIHYTKPGGRVSVSLSAEGDRVRLVVADTGIGIPGRDLPRIFERFYRVDPARSRETGGTGLGLSIVKHIVENHGGEIDVSSELGRGTSVTVTLPAASA